MRIERLIASKPRDVWRALIQHTEIGVRGPMIRLPSSLGVSETAGRITLYESEKVLECTLAGGVLRCELHARGGITSLILTYAEDITPWLARCDYIAASATDSLEKEITESQDAVLRRPSAA